MGKNPSTHLLRSFLLAGVPTVALIGGVGLQSAEAVLEPVTVAASYYGPGLDGRPTASGEIFDSGQLTAAHRTLPFGSLVEVANADSGQSVLVRINDRGPFHGDREIDLSKAAARQIGMVETGTAKVNLKVIEQA